MRVQMILFLSVIVGLLIGLAVVARIYLKRSHATSEASWDQLIARLAFVDRESVQQVALDIIDASGRLRTDEGAMSLNSSEIWRLIGGLPGLEILEKNCEVLIDLAFYLQRWYPEAMITAEELRNNAREIRWHVGRLRDALIPDKVESEFADYARPAIASYYLMTCRVLALYEAVRFPTVTELRRTI